MAICRFPWRSASAKLKLIAERSDDFVAAHPVFAAAFTLTGQP
jgi:hypothetical protein